MKKLQTTNRKFGLLLNLIQKLFFEESAGRNYPSTNTWAAITLAQNARQLSTPVAVNIIICILQGRKKENNNRGKPKSRQL